MPQITLVKNKRFFKLEILFTSYNVQCIYKILKDPQMNNLEASTQRMISWSW
jgi:hypothetical protein